MAGSFSDLETLARLLRPDAGERAHPLADAREALVHADLRHVLLEGLEQQGLRPAEAQALRLAAPG